MNNQIQIWCFVFVTLFNLQGAHRSQRREFILPCRFVLVKNFFQVFQNFLEPFLGTARPASLPGRPRGRPVYIITAPPLCQALFSNLFDLFLRLTHLGECFLLPSRTASIEYHFLPPLSRTFLKFSFSTSACLLRPMLGYGKIMCF